mmetsp:Transcript_27462/g.88690  ORF Transcript_27462/g.88690 Transcript_27462/m.88690 type:complete len:238 (-) Transcript_27462:64-777(-)
MGGDVAESAGPEPRGRGPHHGRGDVGRRRRDELGDGQGLNERARRRRPRRRPALRRQLGPRELERRRQRLRVHPGGRLDLRPHHSGHGLERHRRRFFETPLTLRTTNPLRLRLRRRGRLARRPVRRRSRKRRPRLAQTIPRSQARRRSQVTRAKQNFTTRHLPTLLDLELDQVRRPPRHTPLQPRLRPRRPLCRPNRPRLDPGRRRHRRPRKRQRRGRPALHANRRTRQRRFRGVSE